VQGHPAESKTPSMHRNFRRENRETPLLSVVSPTQPDGRQRPLGIAALEDKTFSMRVLNQI